MVNFWNESWLNINGPLKNYFIGLGSLDETLRVCDFVNASGDWDWMQLSQWLPSGILNLIAALIPPHPLETPDQLIWKWRVNDKFSSKATYFSLYQNDIVVSAPH